MSASLKLQPLACEREYWSWLVFRGTHLPGLCKNCYCIARLYTRKYAGEFISEFPLWLYWFYWLLLLLFNWVLSLCWFVECFICIWSLVLFVSLRVLQAKTGGQIVQIKYFALPSFSCLGEIQMQASKISFLLEKKSHWCLPTLFYLLNRDIVEANETPQADSTSALGAPALASVRSHHTLPLNTT